MKCCYWTLVRGSFKLLHGCRVGRPSPAIALYINTASLSVCCSLQQDTGWLLLGCAATLVFLSSEGFDFVQSLPIFPGEAVKAGSSLAGLEPVERALEPGPALPAAIPGPHFPALFRCAVPALPEPRGAAP